MSHLHLPDGLLPLWLILVGWGLTAGLLGLALHRLRALDARRVLPRLGFVAALMAVSMSAEILPLAYHFNLSVVAGLLLGPEAGFVAAVVVNLFLAFFGHGGLTVVGLNALILGCEMALGRLLFHGLVRMGMRCTRGAAVATLGALATGTGLMVAVVAASRVSPEHLERVAHGGALGLFAALVFGLGSVGWILEAILTAGIVRYLSRVRPGLITA